MSPTLSVAASLSPNVRQAIGIQVLARTEPITHLAATHQVSRKFIYQQGDKAKRSHHCLLPPSQQKKVPTATQLLHNPRLPTCKQMQLILRPGHRHIELPAIALRLRRIPIAAAPELLHPQQQHCLKLQSQ